MGSAAPSGGRAGGADRGRVRDGVSGVGPGRRAVPAVREPVGLRPVRVVPDTRRGGHLVRAVGGATLTRSEVRSQRSEVGRKNRGLRTQDLGRRTTRMLSWL